MRIAQVAPLYESVPPKLYGGTERIVSYLTDELVRQGHQVTLFASGDSVTNARLVSPCHRALRLDRQCIDPLAHHITMLELVRQESHQFDIIHFHIDYLHFLLFHQIKQKTLTTLHGRLDIPDLVPLYKQFSDMPLTSISFSQREPLPWLHWVGNVYHGIPAGHYTFREEPGEYLAFIGRISPEKRVDRAIAIAQEVEAPIRIAAKVDKVDHAYFEATIKPLLRHPLVDYIGEIGEGEKDKFLGKAKALLFPIDWPEPFGLVMIEALACGTPVIAYHRGSVPEVLEQGVVGFIVQDFNEAVNAVQKIGDLKRAACRKFFEERFTAENMTKEYVSLYSSLLHLGPHLEAA
ncbi:MAG: glycosyltransferase family 4 protein [Nitrospirales bacterium]